MKTITTGEYAREVGVTRKTVRNNIDSGRIRADKDRNGVWQIPASELPENMPYREKPKEVDSPIMTSREVAGFLHTTENGVKNLREEGAINFIKRGSGYIYLRSEIDAYVTDLFCGGDE